MKLFAHAMLECMRRFDLSTEGTSSAESRCWKARWCRAVVFDVAEERRARLTMLEKIAGYAVTNQRDWGR